MIQNEILSTKIRRSDTLKNESQKDLIVHVVLLVCYIKRCIVVHDLLAAKAGVIILRRSRLGVNVSCCLIIMLSTYPFHSDPDLIWCRTQGDNVFDFSFLDSTGESTGTELCYSSSPNTIYNLK